MADAGGWTITFDSGAIKTNGIIYSLPDSTSGDEIPLKEAYSSNTGLPFGTYEGARPSDGKDFRVVIRGVDAINSANSPMKWYIGSTFVENTETAITCWDARE